MYWQFFLYWCLGPISLLFNVHQALRMCGAPLSHPLCAFTVCSDTVTFQMFTLCLHTNVFWQCKKCIKENDTDLFLCSAPKSREVDHALALVKGCIAEHKGPLPSVPLHLRNAPTRLMKDLGKFVNWFTCPEFVFLMFWSWMFSVWMFQDMEKDTTWHTKMCHISPTCLKV